MSKQRKKTFCQGCGTTNVDQFDNRFDKYCVTCTGSPEQDSERLGLTLQTDELYEDDYNEDQDFGQDRF